MASDASQLFLAQNDLYATVAYFGVTCSDPLQTLIIPDFEYCPGLRTITVMQDLYPSSVRKFLVLLLLTGGALDKLIDLPWSVYSLFSGDKDYMYLLMLLKKQNELAYVKGYHLT